MLIGLSSVDHMPFIPKLECSTSDDTETKMEFTYDSYVQEEIVEDGDVVDENDYKEDICKIEEKPQIIQNLPFLQKTPRTVVISPKQSKGPAEMSEHLSKPVFIPINLSNIKTIKV